MNGKKRITLSHPLREQLAEVVLDLPDFELDETSQDLIIINSASWKKLAAPQKKRWWKLAGQIIPLAQNSLGIINFRRFTPPQTCDVVFANGGFLLTPKPYITYIEKATQIYGYSSRRYGKPLGRWMLNRFLRQPNLKFIFFRTRAGLDSLANLPQLSLETRQLIRQKGVVVYPPLTNPGQPSLRRFKNPKTTTFLFISRIFYEKGGLELLHAFEQISRSRPHCRLTIISKPDTIRPDHRRAMEDHPQIDLLDATFSRSELFEKFFNRCQVFLYPTYSDSFSAVVNEAMSAYLPVLTSDFFSIPERVIDGKTGFLFPSPFPNYTADKVITEEHFQPGSKFPSQLEAYQKAGKLDYVEEFLIEKMSALADQPDLLYSLAENTQQFYEKNLDPRQLRQHINSLFWQALQ